MQHQKPCNRCGTRAALEFAIPAPLSPDLGGAPGQLFNARLTAQPSSADGLRTPD